MQFDQFKQIVSIISIIVQVIKSTIMQVFAFPACQFSYRRPEILHPKTNDSIKNVIPSRKCKLSDCLQFFIVAKTRLYNQAVADNKRIVQRRWRWKVWRATVGTTISPWHRCSVKALMIVLLIICSFRKQKSNFVRIYLKIIPSAK